MSRTRLGGLFQRRIYAEKETEEKSRSAQDEQIGKQRKAEQELAGLTELGGPARMMTAE
jgi:hypothetical protein